MLEERPGRSKPSLDGKVFLAKGLIVVSLPLVTSSVCLLAVMFLWLKSINLAEGAERRMHSIRLIDFAVADLFDRVQRRLDYCFAEGKLPEHDIEDKKLEAATITRGERAPVQDLVFACEKIEQDIDIEAKLLNGKGLNTFVDRLATYQHTLVRNLQLAEKADAYMQERQDEGQSIFQEIEQWRRLLASLTIGSFVVSILVAAVTCLYFGLDLVKRIRTLAQKAASLANQKPSGELDPGRDEIAFLDHTFSDVALQLAAATRERQMVTGVMSGRILKSAALARQYVQQLVSRPTSDRTPQSLLSPERLARWWTVTDSAYQKINTFANQLLDESTYTTSGERLNLSNFSVKELTDGCLNVLIELAGKKSIDLINECRDIRITADSDKVGRIISNLVSNAIKFSPRNSTVTVSSTEAPPGSITISVTDTGPGISEKERKRLFKKYSQVDGGHKEDGFGLGLSICKTFAEAHGGKIGLRTGREGGCEFWFIIPTDEAFVRQLADGGDRDRNVQILQPSSEARSPIVKKLALLVLIPLVSQTVCLSWIFTRMDASNALLTQLRQQEELTLAESRLWFNLYAGSYSTAAYRALHSQNPKDLQYARDLARRFLSRAEVMVAELASQKTRRISEDPDLSRLANETIIHAKELRDSLNKEPGQDFLATIGDLRKSINRAKQHTNKMRAILDKQFGTLDSLVQQQRETQRMVQYILLAMLCANMGLAILLTIVFARTFGRRINGLIDSAQGIPDHKPVKRPALIADEIDHLQYLLAVGSEELNQADERREDLINAIAHDIRTPMQTICTILGSIELAMPAQLDSNIVAIVAELSNTSQMVDDLLSLDKLKHRFSIPPTELCQIEDLCTKALTAASQRAVNKNVVLDFHATAKNIQSNVNSNQLSELFEKLLLLSIQNTPQCSTVTVRLASFDDGFLFSIEDEGASLQNLFRMASKIEISTTEESFEKILSLALCRELALVSNLSLDFATGQTNKMQVKTVS